MSECVRAFVLWFLQSFQKVADNNNQAGAVNISAVGAAMISLPSRKPQKCRLDLNIRLSRMHGRFFPHPHSYNKINKS